MSRSRMRGSVVEVGAAVCALLILLCAALAHVAPAQRRQTTAPAPQATPPVVTEQAGDADEVMRVESELVQTSVTVLDKKGEFVGGLKREQFEMLIDGKSQPITFFEQVTAGTTGEARGLAAARGKERTAAAMPDAVERGRTVFFFVDDLHLGSASHALARKTLLNHIETRLGPNDQAAVVSPSGRVGFLQQLTDNKAVLRAAVARLTYRPRGTGLTGNPPMTPAQAIAIMERDDKEILEYLIQETIRLNPTLPRSMAESLVRSRARIIAQDVALTNKATLSTLENLLRTAARLPGRKTVIFLSDGFPLQILNADEAEQFRRITDAAARAGAVVHTVDTQGLMPDPYFDASVGRGTDLTSLGLRRSTSDLRAQQEPLRVIAEETGGRAIVNTNDLTGGVVRALEESSRYYLLAWQPEREENRGGKFRRVEVSIVSRPDLTVRLHKGFFSTARPAADKTEKAADKKPKDKLSAALTSVYPVWELPVTLVLSFVDLPERGTVLTTSAGVPAYPLTFKPAGAERKAFVEMLCVVYNEQGKPVASEQKRVELTSTDTEGTTMLHAEVSYNFQFGKLAPGIYQVRVAARDGQPNDGGIVGSTTQWIEIPDLRSGKLAMSSLIIGGTAEGDARGAQGLAPALTNYGVNRRFPRNARLGFYTYIYNSARAGSQGAPELSVRVQVSNSLRVLIDSGERKVTTNSVADPARIPYGADISLSSLPPGRYILQVIVNDQRTKQTVSQSARFEVR